MIGLATVAVALAAIQGAPAIAEDEDIPKREPSLVWELAVDCDGADRTSGEVPPRRCEVGVAGEALYLLEHTRAGTRDGSRLTRFDLATGEVRWATDVGPTAQLDAYDDTVVLSAKRRFEIYDAASGELRFGRDGTIAAINRYGTVLLTEDGTVVALDQMTGAELWRADGSIGGYCRDIVLLVEPAGTSSGFEPFIVVDHRTGAERWRSDEPFDARTDHMTCGFGPFIYTAKGDSVHEWDALSGWLNWTAAVADAGAIELYSDVALVRSGSAAETVVAIERETGERLWERPATEVGALVSIAGRVREDASGVFTLHPLTGDIVNAAEVPAGERFDVIAASTTRVVVAAGTVVSAYGMNDLGMAWQLDIETVPDDVAVSAGYLVVRTGPDLRVYA